MVDETGSQKAPNLPGCPSLVWTRLAVQSHQPGLDGSTRRGLRDRATPYKFSPFAVIRADKQCGSVARGTPPALTDPLGTPPPALTEKW